MNKIGVFIADSHFLTREGLKCLLKRRDDISILGEAVDSNGLLTKTRDLAPDIFIIDFDIPGCFSIQNLIMLRRDFPDAGILVITNNRNKKDILTALDHGVYGYLLKECDETEIVNALSAVCRREKFLCGKVLDSILDKPALPCEAIPGCDLCQPVTLSHRELEIVKMIARGYTTRDIADKLFLSFHTVATHRKNIFKKTGIKSSLELVRYAVNNGIVSLSNSN